MASGKSQHSPNIVGLQVEVIGDVLDALPGFMVLQDLVSGNARSADNWDSTHLSRDDLYDFTARPIHGPNFSPICLEAPGHLHTATATGSQLPSRLSP
jgi:hypothetical protein